MNVAEFRNTIFSIQSDQQFNLAALKLFNYQTSATAIYKRFVELLKFKHTGIQHYSQLPFLPVSLFRNHVITDQQTQPKFYFASSGTTGQISGRHYIYDMSLYEESLMRGFEKFYGDPAQYCILALLPSYLEQSHSSLVYMFEKLIKAGGHPHSGFYLNNLGELHLKLKSLQLRNQKVFIIGVTYALMDLFEKFPLNLPEAIIMETGGMKGRRKEVIRTELHQYLQNKTSATTIHSEYGMTEILSQAYSNGEGVFSCPPWMKVVIRDLQDPLYNLPPGQTGTINIIDLANIHSCAFIATQDLGRMVDESRFEVLGRMDNSEWRGCNLMIG